MFESGVAVVLPSLKSHINETLSFVSALKSIVTGLQPLILL